ncbi:MAG: hypothetical protein IKB72_00445 [Ruminococcus sp.]|nr:hypothetical protein [Ruminococcus sp.]
MGKLYDGINNIYNKRWNFLSNALDGVEILHDRIGCNNMYKRGNLNKIVNSVELSNEQKKEIDDFYLAHYGKKIPYYWHKINLAYTGKFDVRYFPDSIFNPEFERYMDDLWPSYRKVISDKNFLPLITSSAGIRMPQIIISRTKGIWRDCNHRFVTEEYALESLKNLGKAFLKSVYSSGGYGCQVVDFHNGVDLLSGKTIRELVDICGNNFSVQELIKSHSSIRSLYDGSVNTFRVMTYNWRGKIELIPLAVRIGRGKMGVDNISSGGLVVAVDNDGTFHKTAVSRKNEKFDVHPDSGLVFNGYKIDKTPQIIDNCIRLHEMMPQLGIVSWDMTIEENGDPILIEANCRCESIWVPQMVHGVGAFGKNTEDILGWIRQMRKIKPSKRIFYAYGKMKE